MNGIDDLRSTLESHAADAGQADAGARRTAVHERIAVVRRRRRVGAAGAFVAAAAVVAVGVSVLPQGGDADVAPAGPSVFGQDIPERIDSTGFTYGYEEHVTGDGRAVLELEASDEPRLVSWGTRGDDDAVTVGLDGESVPVAADGPDFSDWRYVHPGSPVEVVLKGNGPVALAVYDLDASRPEGVTEDGVTFRATYADSTLLGAVVGDPGESEVVVEPEGRAVTIGYSYFCAGGPSGAWVHVATSAGELLSSGCGSEVPLDAAEGGSDTSLRLRPDEDLVTRLYVTQGQDGPPVVDEDLRIGLGVYGGSRGRDIGAGLTLPERIERDGHTWRLARTTAPEVLGAGATVPAPDLGERMVVLATHDGTDGTEIRYAANGRQGEGSTIGNGTFTFDVPSGGGSVGLERVGGDELGDEAAMGFGFYVRAD